MIRVEDLDEPTRSPEEKLIIAVVIRGILDYLYPQRFQRVEMGYDIYEDAVDYIEGDEEGVRMLRHLDLVGIDGDDIRKRVMYLKHHPEELPKTWHLRKGY